MKNIERKESNEIKFLKIPLLRGPGVGSNDEKNWRYKSSLDCPSTELLMLIVNPSKKKKLQFFPTVI